MLPAVKLAGAAPRLLSALACNAPPVTAVGPLYVLTLLNTSVPLPVLVRLDPLIAPAMVAPLALVSIFPPPLPKYIWRLVSRAAGALRLSVAPLLLRMLSVGDAG